MESVALLHSIFFFFFLFFINFYYFLLLIGDWLGVSYITINKSVNIFYLIASKFLKKLYFSFVVKNIIFFFFSFQARFLLSKVNPSQTHNNAWGLVCIKSSTFFFFFFLLSFKTSSEIFLQYKI